jgi:hypothetical protein
MPETTTITTTCPFCGKRHAFELDAEAVALWRAGVHIQHVFPEMSADDRETLVSGACGPCFDLVFADED